MTTIVGQAGITGCAIAADNQTTVENRPFLDPSMPKIQKRYEFLVACAGSGGAIDIINHLWEPPKMKSFHKSIYEFIVVDVVPSIRRAFETHGWQPEGEESFALLLAYEGQLFEIASDYTVLTRSDGMYALGTGAPYALGALEAGANLEESVEIAILHDIYSGGDIQIAYQVVGT